MRKILTAFASISLAFSAVLPTTSVATASPAALWSADFEDCAVPISEPDLQLATARAAANPTVVDLWFDPLSCPGWVAAGEAFLSRYVSGAAFPSGDKAVWLNEGSGGGKITSQVDGLTIGRTYELSLTAWTDDQDQETTLFVKLTNGGNEISRSLPMAAGQGQQVLTTTFVATSTSFELELAGSTGTAASPVVDGASLSEVAGTGSLANTGSDNSLVLAVGLLSSLAGVGVLMLRRRTAR